MSGISEEFMFETIAKALKAEEQTESIPDAYLKKHNLMGKMEAIQQLHHPTSMKALDLAKKRMIYEKLFLFAKEIEISESNISKGTQYNCKQLTHTKEYIENLPYSLTASQREVFDCMKKEAFDGRRIHALIQGDVGSGKTCSAFLMMFAMADSGYQSLIMAPTQILAKQHYEKLSEDAEKYGYKTVLLTSELKTKERKEILSSISTGEITFIVGTHSLLSPEIEYKNLALAVIDEEHRFGVAQREQLMSRAKYGMHTISMSATPIPRTIAGAIYGSSIEVYDLALPCNRQPIQTTIFSNQSKISEFILKKYRESKQQTYVVCPGIEENEDGRKIATVEESVKQYQQMFQNTELCIGSVTGKMKAEEVNDTLRKFAQNEIQILIATTVIEVGVNVPNANIIVINNAENFGLAQLHQLRGRVGRGSDSGYCILNSVERDNDRLLIMKEETNGYIIANKDMELRGTGNILGTEQSGENEVINLILQYPNLYNLVKSEVKEMLQS